MTSNANRLKSTQFIPSKRSNSTLKWLIYFPVTFVFSPPHNNVLKLQILICTNSYFLRKICTVLQHNECGICNNLLANFNIHDTATLHLPARRFKDVTTALWFARYYLVGGLTLCILCEEGFIFFFFCPFLFFKVHNAGFYFYFLKISFVFKANISETRQQCKRRRDVM